MMYKYTTYTYTHMPLIHAPVINCGDVDAVFVA